MLRIITLLISTYCIAQDTSVVDTSVHDLGSFGPTYPIIEEDFLDHLKQKLEKLHQFGELLKHQKKLIEKSQQSVMHPNRVNGINKTIHPRVFYIDPSLILKSDIVLPDGKILARKGDKFNPLEIRGLAKAILFFDGKDEEQIKWAKNQPKSSVWILINGSPIELSRAHNRAAYFDQGGVYSKKWNIRQVPARVTQDGLRLKVEEISLP